MFLFTTPAEPRATAPATPVVDAIRQGAEQTGTSFEYLLNTAKRESALDPTAKAPTSSATGLFQFIEQTWLGLVKSEGSKLGLSDLSGAISTRQDGTHAVGNDGAREAILKLREDPRVSAVMAGTLTQQNRESLAAATGREPTDGELYMAHLLGARGAADLIRTASQSPERPVARDMPEAAAANRAIFFDKGRPRTAAELYGVLSAGASYASTSSASAAPRTVTATGPTAVTRTGPALHGLFRTDARAGPLSDAVAKLWRVNRATAESKPAALAYFPRLDGSASAPEVSREVVAAPTSSAPAQPGAAAVPLPPPRPRSLGRAEPVPSTDSLASLSLRKS